MLAYPKIEETNDLEIINKGKMNSSNDFIFSSEGIISDESYVENCIEESNNIIKGKTKFILNMAYFFTLVILLSILLFT
jgi:hypothetical protein